MCVTGIASRRQRLWWALVGYFRAYPPLVQGLGAPPAGGRRSRSPAPDPVKAGRPRIRIYW